MEWPSITRADLHRRCKRRADLGGAIDAQGVACDRRRETVSIDDVIGRAKAEPDVEPSVVVIVGEVLHRHGERATADLLPHPDALAQRGSVDEAAESLVHSAVSGEGDQVEELDRHAREHDAFAPRSDQRRVLLIAIVTGERYAGYTGGKQGDRARGPHRRHQMASFQGHGVPPSTAASAGPPTLTGGGARSRDPAVKLF